MIFSTTLTIAGRAASTVTPRCTGEFRADFDPLVMATAIRAAIDAIPPGLAGDPHFDVGHYARELANLFQAATQPEASPRRRATKNDS